MTNNIQTSVIGEIEFSNICESEFIKELRAQIPGIRPEDVSFKQLDSTPYDEIFKVAISCNTKLNEIESISYFGIMDINKNEFYGFDYSVSNGLLYVKLYKEKKQDIQKIGFGAKFETKYPKKEEHWI